MNFVLGREENILGKGEKEPYFAHDSSMVVEGKVKV